MINLLRMIVLVFMAISILTHSESYGEGFKNEQLKYERVKVAYAEKEDTIKKEIVEKGLHYPPKEIFIRIFNPNSHFYLSLGINYPNKSDKKLGKWLRLGGDIFIHGSFVTIGCIPITNEYIKELYLLCVEAKDNGQKEIQVYIFPCRMNKNNMKNLEKKYGNDRKLMEFWKNIKQGYDYFEERRTLPEISVDWNGKYIINNPVKAEKKLK